MIQFTDGRVRVGRNYEHAPAVLWELITDTAQWPIWGPTVKAVECATRFIDQNTRGRVRTSAGIWLPFEINRFEPGCFWDWRVGGVNATGHRIQTIGADDRSVLWFEMPVYATPYIIVCQVALQRINKLLHKSG